MTPNWLKIDPNNLPEGEVVAVNIALRFREKGILVYDDIYDRVFCNGFPVTHYKPLPKEEEREG